MFDHEAVEDEESIKQKERRMAILEALGVALSGKRTDAISARTNSGIEQQWREDGEFYQGIDDGNRHEFPGIIEKPSSFGSTVRVKDVGSESTRSTVFPNITAPYCDAAAARVGDMLLPTDDRNFALEPTPIPDILGDLPEDVAQVAPPAIVAPPPGSADAAAGAPSAIPDQAGGAFNEPMVQLPNGQAAPVSAVRDEYKRVKAEAAKRAEKAQARIDDWLTECGYHNEVRRVIDDCAQIGTGVLKGPVPVKRKRKNWTKTEAGDLVLDILEEIKPASFRVDAWNLYPDGACGDNIHNGSFIWERDTLTEKKLAELKGLPGYIDSQIDLCIQDGPSKCTATGRVQMAGNEVKGRYEIWYFHGSIAKEDMEAAGCECEEGKDSYPAMITMVNDRVIRAALNPLDSGEFPYDVMRWKVKQGHWAGVGVSRQMRTSQRIVAAATRNLMDNAGMGAGGMIVVGRGVIPQNGVWEIRPRKIWLKKDDADGGSAQQDFQSVVIPMLQVELTNIIQLGMKMAEDSTGLPMLLQGQQGTATETLGGMQILNNNGNSVVRRVARLFDGDLTEPHVGRYYDWLMYYSEDANEKGDAFIKARGSTALVERDMQAQEMVNVVTLTLNPAFRKNPEKAITEYLKSRRFDPEAFDYTEEELAKLSQQQPTPAPVVQAAQIRAETEIAKTDKMLAAKAQETQVEAGVDMERIRKDTDRDSIYVQAETQRTEREHEARMAELAVRERLAMLDYANRNQMKLADVKAALAKTAMTLRTQKELARDRTPAPQVAQSAVEPRGRAPNGQGFQK